MKEKGKKRESGDREWARRVKRVREGEEREWKP